MSPAEFVDGDIEDWHTTGYFINPLKSLMVLSLIESSQNHEGNGTDPHLMARAARKIIAEYYLLHMTIERALQSSFVIL